MLYYLDFLFPILFLICVLYALRAWLKSPEDPKKKHVFFIFLFGAVAFTVSSPAASLTTSRFLGISSIARLIESATCLLAIFFAYEFLTDFAPRKKRKLPLTALLLVLVLSGMVFIFFSFLARPELELALLTDDATNTHIFLYNLLFEAFFLPFFLLCALGFKRYARLVGDLVAKARLYTLSIGCFAGALYRIIKLVYLFQVRYLPFMEPLDISVIVRVLNLFMVLFLFAGFVMPSPLERIIKSLGELFALRQIHYSLISLLVMINDARSMLPYDPKMIHYVRRLCQRLGLSPMETEQAAEAARLYAATTGKGSINQAKMEEEISIPSTSTVEQTASAFAEELQFYNQVYQLIRCCEERYDAQGSSTGLMGDFLPIGSRIIKVVDHYLYRSPSPEEGVRQLRAGARKEFDPEVVKAFIKLLEEEMPIEKRPEPKVHPLESFIAAFQGSEPERSRKMPDSSTLWDNFE
ncbi:MAG: hypothetical protein QMD08_04105 [Actinomycetota bacterium]|nr:hypothetical protein [Actinomycetota bacterium]